MLFEAGFKIGGEADVGSIRVGDTPDEVDVEHGGVRDVGGKGP